MERADGRLLLEISDDGVGGAVADTGSGLHGLSDRVAALDGELDLTSPPGGGTRLRVAASASRELASSSPTTRSCCARASCACSRSTGFTVVGEAGDADELLAQAREHRPDIVVTDIRMPPTHTDEGLRAAAAIRAELPQTGVLVLSQYASERYALQLLGDDTTGVGYLLKQRVMEPRSFAEAVRQVARGGTALDPEVVAHMLERRRPGGPIDTLTPRERTVMELMAEGQTNRTIAGGLDAQRAHRGAGRDRDLREARSRGDAEGHRRVLAVLMYLDAQGD